MAEGAIIYIGELPVTALGNLWVAQSERGLVAVEFQTDRQTFSQQVRKLIRLPHTQIVMNTEKCATALKQIAEYLIGERRHFELPIDWSVMTPFQAKVLRLTCAIPYGETTTYREIATRSGNPKSARAVGRAEASNPMPLVIPCHRVLGTDGRLHGYGTANGIESKAWLLELESNG
jgi:methylated-DNA-[protein]-cysteine S-methyltransferase